MSISEQELRDLSQKDNNPPTSDTNVEIVEKTLTKMNFTDSAKKLLLNPNDCQTDMDSLQSIALTQEHLSQVKKSLGAIVDSLQKNPSIISRAAKFWGELPLWQRIIGGVVISGPTLVIGAAAHIGFLVTISGVSVLAYTTSGIVLDDHHFHTQNITQKLKEGIFGIAEVLELTISALDSIRNKLAEEVEKFKEENIKLTNNITQLNQDVETLSYQVELYVETEKLLRKTQEELEKKAESLTKDIEKQNQLIVDNQNEIQQVKTAHEKIQLELSKKVSELYDVREKMGIEVDRAKKIASTLEGTVKSLSNAVISDSNQRHAFHEKLNVFLTDKTNSFDQVAERINKAEVELVEVKLELKNSNERYKQLLKLQEMQIRRLEGLDKHVENSLDPEPLPLPSNESLKSEGLLNSLIMSIENSIDPEQHPAQNKEPVKTGGLLNALSFLTTPQKWIGVGKSEHIPEQALTSTEEIIPNTQSH